MIADATIARLRAKLEDRELSSEEIVEVLLVLAKWYNNQLKKKQNTQKQENPLK